MNNSLFRSILGTLHSLGGRRDGARPSRMGSRHLGGGSAGRLALPALLAAVALGAALPARASTFTVGGSGNTFTVTRSGAGTNAAETVHYRAVGLSAYAGQNFTSKSGSLTFAPGQTSTNVAVSTRTPSSNAYKFQSGTTRAYRFELLDKGGFRLDGKDRTITAGTSVPTNGTFNIKNVTIQSAEYTADDDGYDSNGYKSVASNAYFSAAAPKAYFQHVGAQLRMALDLQAKENDDCYQYLQLLVDNTSTCDDRDDCSDGDPGNISLSRYMAGFEILSGSKDESYKTYTFPVTNASNNGGAVDPWGYGSKYPLDRQKFNSGCRAADGRLVLPLDFNSIVLRLNASGKSGSDEWAAKNVTARIQAIDSTAPTLLDATVSPGPYHRGNTVAVSLAFSEIVVPTPSSGFYLNTSWGLLGYEGGTCGNVLTFSGKIGDGATNSQPLSVTGFFGLTSIKDLAGNAFGGSVSRTINASVAPSVDYSIAYDLAGGALPPDEDPNPDVYNYDSDIITLTPPVRPGYTFAGWSGTGFSGTKTTVKISRSHGDRAYTAHWTPITYFVSFDAGAADATGPMPDQTLTYDAPQALSSNAFTRAGYTFAGWRGADGAIHPDRATVLNLTNAQDAVVSLTATWRPNIPYIDADGTERLCTDYTVLTNATGDVTYGTNGATAWYVVINAVTISGQLYFRDTSAHLILCDGATLAVTNANDYAINASDLTIYGQTNGTGTVTATGNHRGISASNGSVTINGGTVSATGRIECIYAEGSVTINGGTVTATATGNDCGISAYGGSVTINGGTVTATGVVFGIYASSKITLGWTNPTDSITASSYNGSVRIDKALTDGTAIYKGNSVSPSALAGKTLRPAYSITLPEGVVASGVVTQIVNTAYARPGDTVTLSAAAPGYAIGNITVNGVPLADGTCTFTASADGITVTATVGIPYIDADGTERLCTDYTVLTNAAGGVTYGGGSGWYVVTTNVTISGRLYFNDYAAHLILCDGATLAVTNANGRAIEANGDLTIYGQTNGTGTVTANGGEYGDVIYAGSGSGSVTINGGTVTAESTNGTGIYAHYDVTINGGTVTANGSTGIYAALHFVTINGGTVTANGGEYGDGICAPAPRGSIILGWTNPTDSITASSYSADGNGVRVKSNQRLTDGSNIYEVGLGSSLSALRGKTLVPAYSITLPEGVVASGVVTQIVNTAYARPGDIVTLSAAAPGYEIGDITVNGDALEPVDGIYSFAASADGITVTATVTETVGIPVPYIDADGTERICTDYTVITNAAGDVTYGTNGATAWYVVTNAVTISGQLYFDGTAHLILCDGATLAVTNANADAIQASVLTIYGQANGTGTVTANGGTGNGINASFVTINGGTVTANGTNGDGISACYFVTINGGTVTANGDDYGIYAHNDVTINGGTVTANGGEYGDGICAYYGFITLGWTNPTDSITASSYHAEEKGVIVKSDQRLTDGSNIYGGNLGPALEGATLRPYISPWDSLQAQLDAGGTVTLTNDVTAANGDASLTITNAVTLDLNGHTIDAAKRFRVIQVLEGGNLTLTNSVEGSGAITGGNASNGGGVYVSNRGTFEMSGGEISGNTASSHGGGVYVGSGTFTMTGGAISGNTADEGGGVCVDGTFTVSGNPVVSGSTNSVGTADNVLYSVGTITVNGLSPGARIGVTTRDTPTASAPVIFATSEAVSDTAYFFSDDPGYHVERDGVNLLLALGAVYPSYLGLPADPADDTEEDEVIRVNYDAWAQRYGSDALGANETAYLLDVAPSAVTNGVVPLKVAEMGVTNILVSEAGDFGLVARMMGYDDGDTLPIWRLVLASDVAPLKEGFYDALTVCNGYLVLRIGTDLSVPKSEWLETGWFARVEDGRAELLCPEFFLEKYRERVARETGKPCPGLFLSVTLSPRQSSSTAFNEILQEELNGHLP